MRIYRARDVLRDALAGASRFRLAVTSDRRCGEEMRLTTWRAAGVYTLQALSPLTTPAALSLSRPRTRARPLTHPVRRGDSRASRRSSAAAENIQAAARTFLSLFGRARRRRPRNNDGHVRRRASRSSLKRVRPRVGDRVASLPETRDTRSAASPCCCRRGRSPLLTALCLRVLCARCCLLVKTRYHSRRRIRAACCLRSLILALL